MGAGSGVGRNTCPYLRSHLYHMKIRIRGVLVGTKTHVSVSAWAGSAVGRLLSVLVPQFLCQENGDTVVARAKLICICLYCQYRSQ